MISRIPGELPRLLGVASALWHLVSGYVSIWADPRPTSTSAIGYVFVPIVSVGVGVLGFLIGLVLRWVVRGFSINGNNGRHRPVLAASVLLAVVASAAAFGMWTVHIKEEQAQPRIFKSSKYLERLLSIPDGHPEASASLLWDDSMASADKVVFGGDGVTVDVRNTQLVFQTNKRRSEPINLPALDYIRSIYAIILQDKPGHEILIAVVDGRATGRRSAIVVLSDQLTIAYLELVKRCQVVDNNAVQAWTTSDGKQWFGVLRFICDGPVALRPTD